MSSISGPTQKRQLEKWQMAGDALVLGLVTLFAFDVIRDIQSGKFEKKAAPSDKQ
jgi:hypothetical protein